MYQPEVQVCLQVCFDSPAKFLLFRLCFLSLNGIEANHRECPGWIREGDFVACVHCDMRFKHFRYCQTHVERMHCQHFSIEVDDLDAEAEDQGAPPLKVTAQPSFPLDVVSDPEDPDEEFENTGDEAPSSLLSEGDGEVKRENKDDSYRTLETTGREAPSSLLWEAEVKKENKDDSERKFEKTAEESSFSVLWEGEVKLQLSEPKREILAPFKIVHKDNSKDGCRFFDWTSGRAI